MQEYVDREPYLWEETRVHDVVGSNPSTTHWMDNFHILLLQKLLFVGKYTNKRLGMAN